MKKIHTSERLAAKNPQEAIVTQIQRDFNLSRIFAQAHFDQMEIYFREHTALDLSCGKSPMKLWLWMNRPARP